MTERDPGRDVESFAVRSARHQRRRHTLNQFCDIVGLGVELSEPYNSTHVYRIRFLLPFWPRECSAVVITSNRRLTKSSNEHGCVMGKEFSGEFALGLGDQRGHPLLVCPNESAVAVGRLRPSAAGVYFVRNDQGRPLVLSAYPA